MNKSSYNNILINHHTTPLRSPAALNTLNLDKAECCYLPLLIMQQYNRPGCANHLFHCILIVILWCLDEYACSLTNTVLFMPSADTSLGDYLSASTVCFGLGAHLADLHEVSCVNSLLQLSGDRTNAWLRDRLSVDMAYTTNAFGKAVLVSPTTTRHRIICERSGELVTLDGAAVCPYVCRSLCVVGIHWPEKATSISCVV